MMLPKCAECSSKKSIFIKNQDVKGLLSSSGLRTSLSKEPLLGNILFWVQLRWLHKKINEIVDKFLLAGEN